MLPGSLLLCPGPVPGQLGWCYGEIHYNFYLGITLSLFDAYYVCAFSIRHAETLKLRLRYNVSD